MSDVPLLIAALESGDLPPICVKTGETTRDTLRRSFTVVPGWTSGILILFGVLPWLMARAFTGVTVHAVLPMSEPAYRRLRAAERSAAVAILVAIASFAAAAGWDSNVVAGLE
jgi:hypothetical protein